MTALHATRGQGIAAGPGPCPTIATARLTLRPHRLSDAGAIARSLADFQIARMLTRVPAPYDRQDATEWLSVVTGNRHDGWAFAITTDEDVHIGCLSFERQRRGWELGYWLNRLHWRRGYMSEAVSAAIVRFLMRLPGTDLHAGLFADNPASLRVLQKVGFRITGCSDVFSVARGTMVPHLETQLAAGDFHPLARKP